MGRTVAKWEEMEPSIHRCNIYFQDSFKSADAAWTSSDPNGERQISRNALTMQHTRKSSTLNINHDLRTSK